MHLDAYHPNDPAGQLNLTFRGAGRYGMRVHGRNTIGSNPNAPKEAYNIVVWPVTGGR